MLQQKPCSRNVEIPGGEGVIKDPLGTEIPKGGDANQKPSVGGVWIFSGTTQSHHRLLQTNSRSVADRHQTEQHFPCSLYCKLLVQ